jgi:hypothetical protein
MLRWKYSRYDLFRFRFYPSHCMRRKSMRNYQHTAFAIIDSYDIFYGGYSSDTGVGIGCRRRILDSYGFRFSTKL